MKEIKHDVITQGTPKLENMPKEVFNVFCKSILDAFIEERKGEKLKCIVSSNNTGDISMKNKKAPDFSDACILNANTI